MTDHSVIEKEAAFAEEMKKRALRAEEQLAELRDVARALLADIENNASDALVWCVALTGDALCHRPGTQAFLYDTLCDEHAAEHRAEHPGLALDSRELSYAPALRRLRALLSAAAAPPCPACGRHDAPRGQRCAFCAQLGDDLPAG